MEKDTQRDVTGLLQAWSDGDETAREQVLFRLYAELHRIARRHMAGERMQYALQPSALINEAYLRLADWKGIHWKNRSHFFAVSSQFMRRMILVDYARTRVSRKRGGSANRVTLNSAVLAQKQEGWLTFRTNPAETRCM
jgi:RNA polymerase sigma factor (TIGR02999 family)